MTSEQRYDLIVAGSGAAGLAAALIAHSRGLRVAIIEKTDLVGGTTCYSGGVSWVPNSRQNIESGIPDNFQRTQQYLDSTVPIQHEREARRTYLERGPEAIAYLESVSRPLFFVRAINSPDYYPDAEGASQEGRAITPLSCDGRMLGDNFCDLRGPLPELCLFGRQMLELMDVYHLLNARRSLKSAIHTIRLGLRDMRDRVFYRSYGRGVRLTNGNALVANLYKSVLEKGIPVLRNTPLIDLVRDVGGVRGAVVRHNGRRETWLADAGVILATGGFPWSKDLRARRAAEVPFGYSAASESGTGDGIAIAMAHGAGFDDGNIEAAFWTPVSVFQRADGSTARFPHLMADRAKPGLIAVNSAGKRFCNEAENYHDFVRAMKAEFALGQQPFAHIICDAPFLSRYVFGAIPPLASERRRFLKSGYLIKAGSIEELADRIGVDASVLKDTLERYNSDAEQGIDREFGKGSTAYNRYLGDQHNTPNPCLAPICTGPFYAIKVHPGDIGTAAGLKADIHSQVLDAQDNPIPGLYACGNDRNSIMGGYYPSGGITVGPALTFAYLAVEHALAARLRSNAA